MASVMLFVGLFLVIVVQIKWAWCAALPQGMFTTQQYNPVNPLMILLGRSFYLRMTLTYRISGPVGFSDSKMQVQA